MRFSSDGVMNRMGGSLLSLLIMAILADTLTQSVSTKDATSPGRIAKLVFPQFFLPACIYCLRGMVLPLPSGVSSMTVKKSGFDLSTESII